jgi:hypothetical protein
MHLLNASPIEEEWVMSGLQRLQLVSSRSGALRGYYCSVKGSGGLGNPQNLQSLHNSVSVAIAAIVVLAVGVLIAILWTGIGDADISPAGWIAMGFGVIVTLALGIALMALVFISNRRGYDEPGRPNN